MLTRRPLDSPLDHLQARRAAARRAVALQQAESALAALGAQGARAELVGSLARGQFRLNSDVDFLVMEQGPLSQGQIYGIISDHLRDAAFDVIYASRMTPTGLATMLDDAKRPA